MPEWKALNVRKICGSGSKPKICESTLPWKLKLNLLLRSRHGYPDNSPPGQFAPDNSSPIFKQLAPRSFIHYRAKRGAKYTNPRLNFIQIILRSFIHYRTNYSSFSYPLPSLKIGGELYVANCPGDELSDHRLPKLKIRGVCDSFCINYRELYTKINDRKKNV